MSVRTSLTDPLKIAEVDAPGAKGTVGITFCPGKKQADAMTGDGTATLALTLMPSRTGVLPPCSLSSSRMSSRNSLS